MRDGKGCNVRIRERMRMIVSLIGLLSIRVSPSSNSLPLAVQFMGSTAEVCFRKNS
jgi:hypothetical protein